MNFSVADRNAKVFYGLQIFNSIASTICGVSVHGYILYRMLKKVSSLSHPKAIFFLVSTSESVEEFLIIIFNIHRVLIFLRQQWIKKFYIGFTPFALAYTICYGVLMTKSSEKELPESIMEILLVPLIVAVSMICYALISRHFRRVIGYTEKVKQMQARLSTSIYLQGVIHSVLGVVIALVIPLNLLVAELTDDEGVIFRFALFYGLFILVIFRWYSAMTGALMLWSVRGFFQQQKVACVEGKQTFNRLAT
ncbi:hypothetical protein Y032_0046g1304 [Ancylostoma ceylanicum]|uniref:G-protein coupled receptors family 1 profile domain-containing protein n=2 Tax=Ancylostoma ceylanicum TaxID=53326 RepID=A0A016UCL8_9BILA|nr:hypothetical protein Y032_0046g1304 [Ancylostoma ceylanicum]